MYFEGVVIFHTLLFAARMRVLKHFKIQKYQLYVDVQKSILSKIMVYSEYIPVEQKWHKKQEKHQ